MTFLSHRRRRRWWWWGCHSPRRVNELLSHFFEQMLRRILKHAGGARDDDDEVSRISSLATAAAYHGQSRSPSFTQTYNPSRSNLLCFTYYLLSRWTFSFLFVSPKDIYACLRSILQRERNLVLVSQSKRGKEMYNLRDDQFSWLSVDRCPFLMSFKVFFFSCKFGKNRSLKKFTKNNYLERI